MRRTWIAGLLPLVSLLVFVEPASAEPLAHLVARINMARAGGVVELDGPVRIGRATLTPRAPVRVLLAGDEPCGLVFGAAQLTYRVEDRFSRPVALRNLKQSFLGTRNRVESPTALEVVLPLSGAVVWNWELGAAVRGTTGAAPGPLEDWAAKLVAAALFDPPGMTLARGRAGATAGFALALLRAPDGQLLLEVDPVAGTEKLSQLDKLTASQSLAYDDHFLSNELAAQPIGRAWWEHRIASLVAQHVSLQLDNDQGRHVTIASTTRLRADHAPQTLWRADLLGGSIDKDRLVPFVVRSVSVDGRPADYVFSTGQLLVGLDPPLAPGRTAEVRVVTAGDYAIRFGNDSFWRLGTQSWFPTPDLNASLTTFDIEVRTPVADTVFVSGKTVSRETKDGYSVVRTREAKAMNWPVAAAGTYHVVEDRKLDIDLRVGTYARKDEPGARRLANNFFAAVDCYQRRLNFAFPFSEVEVVELNTWGYGQAPPGVIFITQEAFNSQLEERDQAYSEGINHRYFHEIAHSFWPHVAKLDSFEENWTSESFAEYTSAVCLDALAGRDASLKLKATLARWRGEANFLAEGASLYLANHLGSDRDQDVGDRRRLLYAKGPLVLHSLRQELKKAAGETEGERQFWILLRSYLKSFTYQWGGTVHLVALLDRITGKSWQPWFERYVYGTEMPPLDR